MSISDLNHFMTYVLEGWLLFSAGFVGIGFVSFLSRRIQEDMDAETQAIAQAMEAAAAEAESAQDGVGVEAASVEAANVEAASVEEVSVEEVSVEAVDAEAIETARLKEVAAVSDKLAKTRTVQSDASSVSVST
ncbi:MAG: hypothetical protein AAFR18_08400 [Cyanobacteria bacterium J06627_32]